MSKGDTPRNVDNTSSSGPIKGGFSIFGGAWPEYSNTEFGLTIVCVFLSGMSPRSPYLNVDPRYCTHDPDDLILPTDANKVSGRFELAFFTIAGCCITCAAVGALNGPRMGLSETKDMAWSKPLNMSCVFNGYDILTFTLLNLVTRQGATWANTLGSLGECRHSPPEDGRSRWCHLSSATHWHTVIVVSIEIMWH
uniref:Translocase of inner mitochondrial membrane 23 homolog b (yeast) n=1 Tax=Salmo trutta TaxID=8032 RepID=A0A673YL77_SALTR